MIVPHRGVLDQRPSWTEHFQEDQLSSVELKCSHGHVSTIWSRNATAHIITNVGMLKEPYSCPEKGCPFQDVPIVLDHWPYG